MTSLIFRILLKISSLRNHLENNDNMFSDILRVILVPFLIIDYLVALIVLIGLHLANYRL